MSNDPSNHSWGWGEKLGLLLFVAAAMFMVVYQDNGPSAGPPIAQGTTLPPLMAEGWLHAADQLPGRESLAGKVVVLDFWATTCGPCRAAFPRLVEIRRRYQGAGVELIGLTPEPEAALPQIERFLSDFPAATWPIGYGAGPTLDMLGVVGFPTLAVFGRDGKLVWSGHYLHQLEAALDETLAMDR